MAYQILKDNYYTSQAGFGGLYGLRYDPTNGDYVLSQKSAAGYTVGVGLAVFYKNGNWTSDAIKDPKLFTNNDPSKPTALANQLSEDMRRKVNSAYLTGGGKNKGLKIDPTAQNPTTPAGVQNYFPGTNPGIASAVPIVGPILTSTTSFNLDPAELNKIFKFGSVDNNLRGTNLKYPEDALYDKTQDYLQIGQYSYKSPKSSQLFSPTGTQTILTSGVQKNSALAEFLGIVKLPMPNSVTDSNNVSWGDDNMNNLSAAATAEILGNLDKYLAATTAGGLVGAFAGNTGKGMALGAQGALLYNLLTGGAANSQSAQALLKTAGASKVLSIASFSVSPESILARGFGVVPNSNLELLFNSPTLREFTFQYRMSPRSEPEAKVINKIIRFFKQGMAAKKQDARSGVKGYGSAGASSYFLGTPNVFQLQYKTSNGNSIKGVNRIKTCALVGFSMNYTADGTWAAYDDGQPVSVIMNMSFKELEPIYDTDYQSDIDKEREFVDNQKFGTTNSGDLYKITPNDVGY